MQRIFLPELFFNFFESYPGSISFKKVMAHFLMYTFQTKFRTQNAMNGATNEK